MFKVEVFVTLKESVLDPQGETVKQTLHTLGYEEASDLRIGKYIELTLEGISQAEVETRVEEICNKLLANPVIENYRYQIMGELS